MEETIEEAAERYTNGIHTVMGNKAFFSCWGFINGAKSEAAKEYWFQQYRETQCICGGFPECICPHLNKES